MERKRIGMLSWLGFIVLALLPTCYLSIVAAIQSGLFSIHSVPPTDTQLKTILAFSASVIAAAITLTGILLTSAHNRRTNELLEEAERNRQRLAEEEDRRIRLESVAKGLDLLSDGKDYATKARVAGAIATIVHLGYTSIALKTLEPAWLDGAIDPNSATWLIDQVLANGDSNEIADASTILLQHGHELSQKTEWGIMLYLPDRLLGVWEPSWPPYAKFSIIGTITRTIMSQAPTDWSYEHRMFHTLWQASNDSDEATRRMAAAVLCAFVQTAENLARIFGHGSEASSKATPELSRLRSEGVGPDWFFRTPLLLEEVERWRHGVAKWPGSWKAPAVVTQP